MALRFRPFNGHDWHFFSGSEPFADGRDPSIAKLAVDGGEAYAILDATGLTLIFGECGEEEIRIPREEDGEGPAGDLVISDALDALGPETTSIALEALGFRYPSGGPYSWRAVG